MQGERNRQLIEGVLAGVAPLRGATRTDLARIAAQCRSIEVRRAESVVAKGEPFPGAIAVAYGSVKLVLRNGGTRQRVLRLVHAGETFGEASALLGYPSGYDALAITRCKLVVIPASSILALSEENPRICRQVMMAFARRNLELVAELESSSLRRGSQRLAAYLDTLAADGGGNGERKVRLPATKTLIASRLDMKKETLSRLLRRLASQGVIAVEGSSITVLDPSRLSELA